MRKRNLVLRIAQRIELLKQQYIATNPGRCADLDRAAWDNLLARAGAIYRLIEQQDRRLAKVVNLEPQRSH